MTTYVKQEMEPFVTIGARLREERKRLGLSQTEFAEVAGVHVKTHMNYESGERSPDGSYFAAAAEIGVDVQYVITGSRDYEPPKALTAEEQLLLERYRAASREVRNAAMGALLGTQPSRKVVSQVFRGNVGQSVKGDVRGGTASFHLRQAKTPKRKP